MLSMPRALITAVAMALPLQAHGAEVQPMVYRLALGSKEVGSRELGIRYIPGPRGEIRLMEAWTTFVLPLGVPVSFQQRLGARLGGDRSFTASARLNRGVTEVQGRLDHTNTWQVTVAEGGRARGWSHPAGDVDLTSPELLDPERALQTLQGVQFLRVLSAETGTVMDGPLERLPDGELEVGGEQFTVTRFSWTPEEGTMTMAYTQEGVLVTYSFEAAGHEITARLEELPPPRTYGSSIRTPLTGDKVEEEEL